MGTLSTISKHTAQDTCAAIRARALAYVHVRARMRARERTRASAHTPAGRDLHRETRELRAISHMNLPARTRGSCGHAFGGEFAAGHSEARSSTHTHTHAQMHRRTHVRAQACTHTCAQVRVVWAHMRAHIRTQALAHTQRDMRDATRERARSQTIAPWGHIPRWVSLAHARAEKVEPALPPQ